MEPCPAHGEVRKLTGVLLAIGIVIFIAVPSALVGCVAGRITGLLWEWLFRD
jgi:hypothetical protein